MTPIDIQVRRSKVKVKGHASLLHLVQLITQERLPQKLQTWEVDSPWRVEDPY